MQEAWQGGARTTNAERPQGGPDAPRSPRESDEVDLRDHRSPERAAASLKRHVNVKGPDSSLLGGSTIVLPEAGQQTVETQSQLDPQGTRDGPEGQRLPPLAPGTDSMVEALRPAGGDAVESQARDCADDQEAPEITNGFSASPDGTAPVRVTDAESANPGSYSSARSQNVLAKPVDVAGSSREREPPERPSTPPIAESQRSPRMPEGEAPGEAAVCPAPRDPEGAVLEADPGSRVQDLAEDDLHSGLFQWAEESAVGSLGNFPCLPSSQLPHG